MLCFKLFKKVMPSFPERPFEFSGDWQNQVDQLLLQEEAKHRLIQVPLLIPQEETQDGQELNMSMRPSVDHDEGDKLYL